MARSKTAARISAGRSWNDAAALRLALERGVRWTIPTCCTRELRFEGASEDRDTSRTASGNPTSSWRRRFFWLVTCDGTAGLFPFAFIEACKTGMSEIYDVQLVCPSVACSRTNFAASLSANVSKPGGEDDLRCIL